MKLQSRLRRFQALFVIPVLSACLLPAAETTGSVRGDVTDETGAVVPDAQIELINARTGVVHRQKSGAEGQFQFNLMPPGDYVIKAAKEGFRPLTITGIAVEVNKTTLANFKLAVGAVTQSVEVAASSDVIDTASAKVSTNIERRYVVELPSSTRNALTAALLAPGVLLSNTGSQVMDVLGTAARVNGMRGSSNIFYLDGSDNTGSFRNASNQFPNPEAVAEVQVSSANTSAEYGKQPGGMFNVITKSGTNEVHGSGFYFFRDEALNANEWARNRAGSAKPTDRVKQGGGTLGGPIRRNRTFFFASFMFYRDDSASFQNTIQFPTKAMLAGAFAQFGRPLYDPDTGAALPGNTIPRNRLDPVAAGLAALLPTVGNLGERLAWSYNNPVANQELLAKIDENFRSAHRFQASYFLTRGDQKFNPSGNNVPAWYPQVNDTHQHTVSATHIWVPRPTLVVESRFALSRHVRDAIHGNMGKNLADFGAKWPNNAESARKYLPILRVSDGFSTAQGNLAYFSQPNYSAASTATRSSGRHNLKFGARFQKGNVRQFKDNDQATFQFDGRASSKLASGASQGVGVFGYAAADFLMGRVATFSTIGLRDYDIYSWSDGFFVQDEWRLNRNLTVTSGLRYEVLTSAREKNKRASEFLLGHRSSQYPNAPVGIAFDGDAGVAAGFYSTPRNNLAPRLGLAYDPAGDGRTALRAAAGYYFAGFTIGQKMFSAEGTPWNPTAAGGGTLNLVDPWGTSQTVKFDRPPTPFSTDISKFSYPPRITDLYSYNPNFRSPYVFQWNLSAEREVRPGIKLWAGYIGNRGFKFLQLLQPNLPVWRSDASLQNIEARRPIPGFGSIIELNTRSRSWYDAFQLAADTRLGKGFVSRFVYTLARNQSYVAEDYGSGGNFPANPLNANGEKGPDGPRHVGRLFYIYELPFLSWRRGLPARLLGGWQLSGSFSAISGSPINPVLGTDWNFDGIAGDRPDLVGPIRYASGSKDARMASYFDKTSFAAPSSRTTFGTLRRNALRGPGSWGADCALAKSFHFTESRYLQVRAEAYNVTNHNNLANPNVTMSSVDFTRITTRTGNRTMQIGLRFLY